MTARNTICLWYDGSALEAAQFHAETFPDSRVGAVRRARAAGARTAHLVVEVLQRRPILVDRAGAHLGQVVRRKQVFARTVTLCTSTGPSARPMWYDCITRRANGISVEMPSEPCRCSARDAMSCSTLGIAALIGRDVLAHQLVVLVLVDQPRGAQHQQAELLELDPGVGDLLLHHLLARQQLALRDARHARSHIMSSARRASPIVRIAWWMRPPPRRTCATTKACPGLPSMCSPARARRRSCRYPCVAFSVIPADVAHDLQPRASGRHDEHRHALVAAAHRDR
jgi:hypothetical protein